MGLQKLEVGYSARRQPIAPPSRTLGRVRAHAGMYVHHTMSAATDTEYNRTHTLSKVRATIFPPPERRISLPTRPLSLCPVAS